MSSPTSAAARSTYDGEFNTNNSAVTNGDVNNNNNSDINTGNINNNNGDFNTNNNNGASANASSDITDSSGGTASVIQGALDSATRTMYATSITTLVLLVIQFLALCAILAIWLRSRSQRRRRERQKIEEQGGGGGVAGYLYPTVGYWGLASDAQQQTGTQAQRGQTPWYDIPHPAGTRREMSA
ncbi:hypothetical protein F5Y07DRAFT_403219 [Xylaria sp. FL0933]|nr:hypothetical protein F5Y07DRAFT_403219 [Xylaria sp. FL0933]